MIERLCPRCQSPLSRLARGTIALDACHECGGVWFDAQELEQLRRQHRGALAFLDKALKPRWKVDPSSAPTPLCPVCRIPLVSFAFANVPQVTLDGCRQCRGLWTDHGELTQLQVAVRRATGAAQPSGGSPCPNCGATNYPTDPVCLSCGTALLAARPQTSAGPSQPPTGPSTDDDAPFPLFVLWYPFRRTTSDYLSERLREWEGGIVLGLLALTFFCCSVWLSARSGQPIGIAVLRDAMSLGMGVAFVAAVTKLYRPRRYSWWLGVVVLALAIVGKLCLIAGNPGALGFSRFVVFLALSVCAIVLCVVIRNRLVPVPLHRTPQTRPAPPAQAPPSTLSAVPDTVPCPRCRTDNPRGTVVCARCQTNIVSGWRIRGALFGLAGSVLAVLVAVGLKSILVGPSEGFVQFVANAVPCLLAGAVAAAFLAGMSGSVREAALAAAITVFVGALFPVWLAWSGRPEGSPSGYGYSDPGYMFLRLLFALVAAVVVIVLTELGFLAEVFVDAFIYGRVRDAYQRTLAKPQKANTTTIAFAVFFGVVVVCLQQPYIVLRLLALPLGILWGVCLGEVIAKKIAPPQPGSAP